MDSEGKFPGLSLKSYNLRNAYMNLTQGRLRSLLICQFLQCNSYNSSELIKKYRTCQTNLIISSASTYCGRYRNATFRCSDPSSRKDLWPPAINSFRSNWPQLLSPGHALLEVASAKDQARCATRSRLSSNARLF